MPSMEDLEVAVVAARAGGAVVADAFGRHQVAVFKARNDPVTEVDRVAEAAIAQVLVAHRPDDAVLGEEGTEARGGGLDRIGRRWLVDPLDGTVNFVHGVPQVAVSVALYDGNRGLTGVVFDPLRNELFAADAGRGATMNGAPIRVTAIDDLGDALVATGFPYDHHRHAAAYTATLTAVLERVNGIRRIGSAALDLCYVANGRFDGYWEYQLKPWDLAAGVLIAREAGAVATEPMGGPMTPYLPHTVAAGPGIHEALRRIVESTFPEHLRGD